MHNTMFWTLDSVCYKYQVLLIPPDDPASTRACKRERPANQRTPSGVEGSSQVEQS